MRYSEPNGRGGGRADWIVLLVLLACGLVAASLDNAQQLRVAAAVRGSALWPFLELHRGFSDRARLGERVSRALVERDSLARETLRSRRLLEDARQIRRMAGLTPRVEGELVSADLMAGRPRVGDSDVFVLRGPELARVAPPTGVLVGDRLLGVLRTVDGAGGLGEFWTHPDFRVSVRTPDGEVTGIVRAVRPEGDGPVMVLEGAPYQGEVPPGTPLFTSGLAGIHPPGVWVGTVRELWGVESGWAKSYVVEPAARPEAADVVLVWRRPPPSGS